MIHEDALFNIATEPVVCDTADNIMSETNIFFDALQDWTWTNALATTFIAWVMYYVAIGIYRIYFHPLAKFPGPKVSATHMRICIIPLP